MAVKLMNKEVVYLPWACSLDPLQPLLSIDLQPPNHQIYETKNRTLSPPTMKILSKRITCNTVYPKNICYKIFSCIHPIEFPWWNLIYYLFTLTSLNYATMATWKDVGLPKDILLVQYLTETFLYKEK